MQSIFLDITVVICLAAVLSLVFRLFKQPPMLAYILTGVLLGPLGIFPLHEKVALQTLGELGITLLLFMLGLELKLGELKAIGKTALIGGLLQMWFTFVAGFFLTLLLGYSTIAGIYIGIALSFSSTIIIVKMLSDKKDLTSLHGKIAIGILLMQDFFAVLTLVFLSGKHVPQGSELGVYIIMLLFKLSLLVGAILFLSQRIFPKITSFIAKSPETLFLFSLAWVFALSALVASPLIGFSIEIGGFLAGLALAGTRENFHIISKMKALRDFFITIFFVMLGLEMTFANVSAVLGQAVIVSLFVLLVKPFIVMVITGWLGYRKRTSFLVGSSMGQISEFSLIILFLGVQRSVISSELATMMVLSCMITFTGSTYVMQNWNFLYKKLGKYLSFLEGEQEEMKQDLPGISRKDSKEHIVVIGGDTMGQSIVYALADQGVDVVVIDFNPDIIKALQKKNIPVLFGDISDAEIQEHAGLENAKLVISTIPDMEDNLLLIDAINHKNRRAKIVVMSYEVDDAKLLYKKGADYVILPHLAGGRHLAKMLLEKDHLNLIENYKQKDLSDFV